MRRSPRVTFHPPLLFYFQIQKKAFRRTTEKGGKIKTVLHSIYVARKKLKRMKYLLCGLQEA
jgi:hypothetical protein